MIQYIQEEPWRSIGDGFSVGVVLATLLGWLPHIAAAMTIAWTGLRIYETWLSIEQKRRRMKRRS